MRAGYWRRTAAQPQSGPTTPSRHTAGRAAHADPEPGPRPTSKAELPSSWASPAWRDQTHVRGRSPAPEYLSGWDFPHLPGRTYSLTSTLKHPWVDDVAFAEC